MILLKFLTLSAQTQETLGVCPVRSASRSERQDSGCGSRYWAAATAVTRRRPTLRNRGTRYASGGAMPRARDLLHQANWVNMGGGHLMTREGYDTDHLIGVLKRFREKYEVDVILEPGSAIAWQTGVLVSTVLDVFDSQGIDVAVLPSK